MLEGVIDYKTALKLTEENKDKLAERERGKVFKAIARAIEESEYYVEYKAAPQLRKSDLEDIMRELQDLEFTVERSGRGYGIIVWWKPTHKTIVSKGK